MTRYNRQGQPIGPAVANWSGCETIPRTPMRGAICDVVPLEPSHSDDLFAAYALDTSSQLWTYMTKGPFASQQQLCDWVSDCADAQDTLFFAVIDKATDKAIGVVSYLRLQPENGVV
ncbi:GNAT family N-acetyltransferase [Yoonia sediminilitoris]|uniref:Acetyltransferase (GNAT) family protein n=1 Tax=Yoonia sediminilitoris TaxID=1286148 RepID=A0A2T6KPU6_9RHOB|nr:hypothetical protein [Yoonia sediminilitoris]PUB18580.1 hypothetical protein C8N45_101164 [Yoonia sediminilitoris]RCW98748.1 hypothetical protein DFP92_101164 [Yoonia sediminilitoris]